MIVIKNERLRRVLKILIPLVLIPLVVAAGVVLLKPKHHAIATLAVAVLALFLFFAGYEKKQTGSRRMVLVAVMTALSVAGRFIPLFKPMAAIAIISGMWLGGEAGFLVGALSAVISNFYFGQGPWTPFQMFAWGLIGLFSGILYTPLKKSRVFLAVYALLCGVCYSFIMDIWSTLWYSGTFVPELFLSALVTALPHTIMYSVSNVIFIWLLAKPFGEKLGRIKTKYGV